MYINPGLIFYYQLATTTRYGESRAAYREVQERQEDLRKLENTLAELAELFLDVRPCLTRSAVELSNPADGCGCR